MEQLFEDFGECECGQLYRITSGWNGKPNVKLEPISSLDVVDSEAEEVIVWPGKRLVQDDA